MSWPLEPWLRRARQAGQRAACVLWTADGVHDLANGQHHARFEDWCAAHAGSVCRILLSGDVLLDLLPEPGTPAQPGPARLQWAQRVLAHYHGDDAAAWPLRAWPAAYGHALGVSAWRGPSLDALRASAARHGVTLRGVHPLWPALLQGLLRARPALARAPAALAVWVEGGCASIATLRHGRLAGLQRRRLPAEQAAEKSPVPADAPAAASADALADAPVHPSALSTLRRLVDDTLQGAPWPVATLWLDPVLRPADAPPSAGRAQIENTAQAADGLDLAVVWSLADLARAKGRAAPSRWWRPIAPRLDFTRPLPQPGLLAWVVCVACGAVLAAAAAEAQAAYRLLAAAQALVPPGPGPLPTPGGERGRGAQRSESAVWQAQAAHPWLQVMQASERASLPGVRWQLLEHEAGGELRLRGRSAQPGQARAVAAALRRQGPWAEVWVVRQELQDDSTGSAGSGGEDFEIVARATGQRP